MTLAARLSQAAPLGGSVLLAVVAGFAATHVALQVTTFALALAVAFVLHSRERVLVMATFLVPIMGLVRRLMSGNSGYTDSDPLVLLPISLVVLVLLVSIVRPSPTRVLNRWVVAACIATALGVLITIVLRAAVDVNSLYSGLSIAVPLLLAAGVVSERVPDVFSGFVRVLPVLAVACGIYGVVQFLFLPDWDRSWMITSDLRSIGQPYPLAVRVFGTAESPGPYSSFIGLAIVIGVTRGVIAAGAVKQAAWFLMSTALAIPLLLSGVRTALIGVIVCVGVLVIVRGRGAGRVLPLAVVAVAGVALTRILGAVAGSSTILTTDRYTQFDSSTDGSFQSRAGLLGQIGNPFAYVIGSPGVGHLDNLNLDVLVSYGLLAAIGVTAVFAFALIGAVRNLFWQSGEAAALCTIFIGIMAISGSVFASPFGILAGVTLGSTFLTRKRAQTERALLAQSQALRGTVLSA